MINPYNPSLTCAAFWYWHQSQQQQSNELVYTRAKRVPFQRPKRWEPWKDDRIPVVRFLELFHMALANFLWLSDKLRDELQQDPLGQGNPLTVEAQVAVGLYRSP
ncbi:hypothetical protein PCANC_06933 [Puccinia coronata f. sp. avenae]|uniref:Uncharacterized protein n=1 Tax=Puccinia coronata f. sp. avenae TaxID=200324 RepID=A0A2N5T4L4_9BASI|nr:hypothetical protein PCANC_08318 [Puccinia coronata f. sp. avenae]PLW50596.1 hypothetical protein PCANC_06933 [Puccinia coronata f. sp. avenae]